MKHATAVLFSVLVAGFVACGSGGTPSPDSPNSAPASPTVLLPDGSHLSVRIADRPLDQARGLMFVENLPDDEGMLFLFDEDGPRSFWMKNCRMPIDMIWLDGTFRVVDITHSAPPCESDPCPQFEPKAHARNVLEVRGGLARQKGLREGDTVVVVGVARPQASR